MTSLISRRTFILWHAFSKHQFSLFLLNKHTPTFYVNHKQEISLFLHKVPLVSHPSFLPLVYPPKNIISGLMTLSLRERLLLTEDSPLGFQFRTFLKVIHKKVLYNLSKYKINYITENFMDKILENMFGLSNQIKMSPMLYEIIGNKIGVFIQHFVVLIKGNHTFNYTLLEKFCKKKGIDCSTFEGQKVSILTFIEVTILHKLKKLIKDTTLEYHVINAEGFVKSKVYFNEYFCKEQTGQKHSDALITKETYNLKTTPEKFYYDVKSYVTVGINYRRISLYYSDDKTCLKLINDIMTTFQKYITDKNLNKNHHIVKLFDELKDIKQTVKNIENRFILITNKLLDIIFDPLDKDLYISIAINAGKDEDFDNISKTILTEKEINFKEAINYFPEKPIIEDTINQQNILDFIDKHLEPSLRENTKEILETILWK